MPNDKPDETRVAGLLEDAEGQALTAQSLANVSQSLIRRAVWRETWMPRSALIDALFANADQFCTDAEQRIADADVLLAEAEALMAAAGEDNPSPELWVLHTRRDEGDSTGASGSRLTE